MNMTQRITRKLEIGLNPTQLDVINESHLHAGHAGDDGSGESHFKVEIASELFNGKSRVAQQRLVYKVLHEEMLLIHALSITIS